MIIFDSIDAAEARAADVLSNEEQQRSYGIIPIEVRVAGWSPAPWLNRAFEDAAAEW